VVGEKLVVPQSSNALVIHCFGWTTQRSDPGGGAIMECLDLS